MSDLRIERDNNTGKLTVTKCEAFFTCTQDFVHKFVNQVNTLIDQNAILRRELSEAREENKRLIADMILHERMSSQFQDERDALAEAMTEYMNFHMRHGFVTTAEILKAEEALAAVKGDQHE